MEAQLVPSGSPKDRQAGVGGRRDFHQSRHHSTTFRLLDFKPITLFVSQHSNRIQDRLGLEVS